MKPTPFNHIFLIDYIFITFKSATPLLGGVVPRGEALKCSALYLNYFSHIWTNLDETNTI